VPFVQIDHSTKFPYFAVMDAEARKRAEWRSYQTSPWRKSRICARFILRPELVDRPRYRKIAQALVNDPDISNRLISQAIWSLKGAAYERSLGK
jgi:hypothetical protein